MAEETVQHNGMPDEFDRLLGALDGLPDVTRTRESTMTVIPTLGVGGSRTFVLHTVRQAEQGDTVFMRIIGPGNTGYRLVLPPEVTAIIARQRDSLGTIVRRKHGRRLAAERKERGEKPAFLKAAKKHK